MAKIAPGPQGHPIIGMLREMRRDPIRFFMESTRDYGDVVRFRVGPYTLHLFRHPDHVKHVLQDNNKNYGRQTKGYQKLALALGQGLVTSEGEFWRRQRRIAQPAFHRKRIAGFADLMVRATDDLSREWDSHAASGTAIDVAAEMMRLTLRIAGETLLSTDPSDRAALIAGSLIDVQHE